MDRGWGVSGSGPTGLVASRLCRPSFHLGFVSIRHACLSPALEVLDLKEAQRSQTLYMSRQQSFTAVGLLGDQVLAGDNSGTVRLLQLSRGGEPQIVMRGGGQITDIATSRSGAIAACSSSNGSIRFIEMRSGKESRTVTGPPDSANHIAFATDDRLAVGGSEGRLRVLDVKTGQEQLNIQTGRSPIVAVAGSLSGWVVVAFGDGKSEPTFVNCLNGTEVPCLRGKAGPASVIACTEDGRLLLCASAESASCWQKQREIDAERQGIPGDFEEADGIA